MKKSIKKAQQTLREYCSYLLARIHDTYRKYTTFCEEICLPVRPREHLYGENGRQFAIVFSFEGASGGTGQLYSLLVICSDTGFGGARAIENLEKKGHVVFAMHIFDLNIRYYATPSWLSSRDAYAKLVGASLCLPIINALEKFHRDLGDRVQNFIKTKTRECEKWVKEHKENLRAVEFFNAIS